VRRLDAAFNGLSAFKSKETKAGSSRRTPKSGAVFRALTDVAIDHRPFGPSTYRHPGSSDPAL